MDAPGRCGLHPARPTGQKKKRFLTPSPYPVQATSCQPSREPGRCDPLGGPGMRCQSQQGLEELVLIMNHLAMQQMAHIARFSILNNSTTYTQRLAMRLYTYGIILQLWIQSGH